MGLVVAACGDRRVELERVQCKPKEAEAKIRATKCEVRSNMGDIKWGGELAEEERGSNGR